MGKSGVPRDNFYNTYIFLIVSGIRSPPKHEDSVRLEAGPLANGNSVLYIAATCACALILVVVSFASCLYIRNSKARSQHPR